MSQRLQLFFVVWPGDLIVAEESLQLLHRNSMVSFSKGLRASKRPDISELNTTEDFNFSFSF